MASRSWPAHPSSSPRGLRRKFPKCGSWWRGPASSRSDGAMGGDMAFTRRSLLQLAGSFAAAPSALAQDWPTRTIRILVGTAAGGSPDIVSRIVADKLAERLGWTLAIENNTTGAGAGAPPIVTR